MHSMSLTKWLLQHLELITQLLLALGLAAFTWIEWQRPRVPCPQNSSVRWWTNVLLYALGAALMWAVFEPLSALAIQGGALVGWGGLAATTWPTAVKVGLGVLLIDFYQYLLHWASHHVPWWWRLHKVHHGDTTLDASTAVRHHPLELLINGFLLVLLLAATGVPVYAILAYGLVQQIHGLFCHANIALPAAVDRWLRLAIVTPDLHAVHHSIRLDEGNSNFGMVFPWWDWLLRSYCAQAQQGRGGMRMGVATGKPPVGVWGQLLWPFSRESSHTTVETKPVAASRKGRRKPKA